MIFFSNGSVVLDGSMDVNERNTVTYVSDCVKCGHFLKRHRQMPVKGRNVEDSSDEDDVKHKLEESDNFNLELSNSSNSFSEPNVTSFNSGKLSTSLVETCDFRFILVPEEIVYCLGMHQNFDFGFPFSLDEYYKKYVEPIPQIEIQVFVYKFYTLKGWFVRKGSKFGSDFVLYRDSPQKEHSYYTVQIVHDENQFDLMEILAVCRSARQVRKTTLFIKPPNRGHFRYGLESYLNDFNAFEPVEFSLRRWKP